jgi:hypothetical protein
MKTEKQVQDGYNSLRITSIARTRHPMKTQLQTKLKNMATSRPTPVTYEEQQLPLNFPRRRTIHSLCLKWQVDGGSSSALTKHRLGLTADDVHLVDEL